MLDRKPLILLCTTGVPGKYPPGMDPPSMAVQIGNEVWRWYLPEIPPSPAAEPLIRNWANFALRVYQAAGEHGRKRFAIKVVIGPDNLPFMQVVEPTAFSPRPASL